MLFGAVTISIPVLTIVTVFTTLYPKNVDFIDTDDQYMRAVQAAYTTPNKLAVLSKYLRKKSNRDALRRLKGRKNNMSIGSRTTIII